MATFPSHSFLFIFAWKYLTHTVKKIGLRLKLSNDSLFVEVYYIMGLKQREVYNKLYQYNATLAFIYVAKT